MTDNERLAFLHALGSGDTLEAAARKAGKSRRTFQRERQADPGFDGEVLAAIDAGNQMIEQRLVDIALGHVDVRGTSPVTAALLVLKFRIPEWRDAARMNPELRPQKPKRQSLKELSDDDLETLDRLLAKVERSAASDS